MNENLDENGYESDIKYEKYEDRDVDFELSKSCADCRGCRDCSGLVGKTGWFDNRPPKKKKK